MICNVARLSVKAQLRAAPALRRPATQRRNLPIKAAVATYQELQPTFVPQSASRVLQQFSDVQDGKEKYALLLQYAKTLPELPAEAMSAVNRVWGCTSKVWVDAQLALDGTIHLSGTSDSELSKGLLSLTFTALSGLTPVQLLAFDSAHFQSCLKVGPAILGRSRVNALDSILRTLKKRVAMLQQQLPRFPSLMVTADGVEAQGVFAEVQAQYLQPDPAQVDRLVALLSSKRIGVVAHFYMDPQVQGVLVAAAERWPHIHISDSLVMADTAVNMAQAGCTSIAVLGVDFMSENVRAILDQAGHSAVKVYRMAADDIGCSLAEAAESPAYRAYLEAAAQSGPGAVHVVYINTSLRTKAEGHGLVPTITCTSSNVVQTVLQVFAQVPGASVWYGPDTYMGQNLTALFTSMATWPDEDIRALHPAHSTATIAALLPRLHHFDDGMCVVHHIFGGEVCELVRQGYGDAYLTAHFEVPGEMFRLAMEAKAAGRGTVGSTQNILDFILARLRGAVAAEGPQHLQFVLGTEAGMVTAIVRRVQALLVELGRQDVAVEVVFPVAPQAITTAEQVSSTAPGGRVSLPGGLAVLPGPAGGEGCSLEGGCATCPFMKMNTLDALMLVCDRVGTPAEALLAPFEPKPYAEQVNGATVAQAGCVPILHMRHFQKHKVLSDEMVADVLSRNAQQVA